MPSRMGGAAHFGGKPIGVGESGPIKLEPFLDCNELRGVPVGNHLTKNARSLRALLMARNLLR
jgi:hypothetical protein